MNTSGSSSLTHEHQECIRIIQSYEETIRGSEVSCLLNAAIGVNLNVWVLMVLLSMVSCKGGDERRQGYWQLAKGLQPPPCLP
jgi:hypothetical protein